MGLAGSFEDVGIGSREAGLVECNERYAGQWKK